MIITPHIKANENEISKIVIMPGDPKRSKFIADNFLENPELITDIRGIQCYTGNYKNKKITVMASGMGNASMGIYSYELYKNFNVQTIIRVGTAGALNKDIDLNDILISEKVLTNTNYNQMIQRNIHEIASSSALLEKLHNIAKEENNNYIFGSVYNTDTFYDDQDQNVYMDQNAYAVEMETAALYENAKRFNKDAIAIYTITDHLLNNTHLPAEDRETNIKKMIHLAFKLIERID